VYCEQKMTGNAEWGMTTGPYALCPYLNPAGGPLRAAGGRQG